MTIRDELLAIQAADADNILRPEAVHKWARNHPKSALYKSITWDTGKAAYEYQLYQIRHLIVLNIRSEDGEPQIVSLPIDRVKSGGGYRSINDVIADKKLSACLLQDALNELDRVKQKYARIQELTSVWTAVAKVRSKFASKGKEKRATV